jgi:hypothetical protein
MSQQSNDLQIASTALSRLVRSNSTRTPLGLHLENKPQSKVQYSELSPIGLHSDSEQSDQSPIGQVGECKVLQLV